MTFLNGFNHNAVKRDMNQNTVHFLSDKSINGIGHDIRIALTIDHLDFSTIHFLGIIFGMPGDHLMVSSFQGNGEFADDDLLSSRALPGEHRGEGLAHAQRAPLEPPDEGDQLCILLARRAAGPGADIALQHRQPAQHVDRAEEQPKGRGRAEIRPSRRQRRLQIDRTGVYAAAGHAARLLPVRVAILQRGHRAPPCLAAAEGGFRLCARQRDGLGHVVQVVNQAHAAAACAGADGHGDWLVFTWDGVGYGADGTLWGGEAFLGRPGSWQRFASLRPFRLPGGDKAGREPWRSAAALHWECGTHWNATPDPDGLARAAWRQHVNCPSTSAAGRLFDAAAAIICDMPTASFEAQGPMVLEAMCRDSVEPMHLPLDARDDGILRSDWQPLLGVIADESLEPARRAELFHASMAGVVLDQALAARRQHAVTQVGLGGGVFQNRVLAERVIELLEDAGFEVYLPQTLPCNDAALSFGQAAEAAAREATS